MISCGYVNLLVEKFLSLSVVAFFPCKDPSLSLYLFSWISDVVI